MKLTLTKNMAQLFSRLNQAINHINRNQVDSNYHIASVDRNVVWITDGKKALAVGTPITYGEIERETCIKELANKLLTGA